MRFTKLLLLFVWITVCVDNAPAEQPRLPVLQTLEFDVFVEGEKALIVYTGSSPARSSNDFVGGEMVALGQATGCGLHAPSVQTTDKAILGVLDCRGSGIAPVKARGNAGRISPRRGLGESEEEPK